MVEQIRAHGFTDFSNPRYENISWLRLLEETVEIVRSHGYVLHKPQWGSGLAEVGPPAERLEPPGGAG
jgi:hypothetical protein